MSKNNLNKANTTKEIVNVTVVEENEKINPLAKYQDTQIDDPLTPEYEEPQRYGDYFRVEKGSNSIRVLSSAIVGCEYWIEQRSEDGTKKMKPIRRPSNEANNLDAAGIEWDYFHAFFIWNYKAHRVQLFSTTKRGIIKGIKKVVQNPKWGKPFSYDLCIDKTQKDTSDNFSVEYSVTPEPIESNQELEKDIKNKWEYWNFDRQTLFMLFEGLDPFEVRREQLKQAKEAMLAQQLGVQA